MAITMITSPRGRVLQALRDATNTLENVPTDANDITPPLQAGDMQVFSSMKPGLSAGDYKIEISQEVYSDDVETLQLPVRDNKTPGTQTFTVLSPRFSIPEADIHSAYPPQGHSDQPNVSNANGSPIRDQNLIC